MKQSFFIILLALITCLPSFSQTTKRERNLIKQGNEYFNKKRYDKADECYTRVLEFNPNSPIAKYNLGTSWLRQRGNNQEKNKRDTVAMRYLNDVGSNPNAPASLRAHSYYNLGKLAYDNQDYANSVEYFKKSLKVNPKDEQARKNLRMAQKKLQQGKNDQDKNKDKNNNNDKNQDKQQPPQQQPQPPKEQQNQTNKDQLLKAMQNEERNTRDKVNRRKAQTGQRRQSNHPW